MNVWKVSVPTSAIACGGRELQGCRTIRVNAVRYVDCGPCAVELKQKHPGATIDLVEPDSDVDVVRCARDSGAQDIGEPAGARRGR